MNLVWNLAERRFEARFVDFQGDLIAVKNAGFRTTGAPQWIWWTNKIAVLNKLRKNRPASDLTIDVEALQIYKVLNEQFEKNQEIKKELARQRKLAKQEKFPQPEIVLTESGEIDWSQKFWIDKEDLPPMPAFEFRFPISPPPDLKCKDCGSGVYFYEYEQIPQCLWCSKLQDDALEEFFEGTVV